MNIQILSIKNIKNIAVHHAGGIKNNPYASTIHLTAEDVDSIHKNRWTDFESSLGYYGGYNFYYEPLTRKLTQFRKIGEETAAQKGHNFDSISFCIGGNYIINQRTGLPVDTLTQDNKEDISNFLFILKKMCDVEYNKIIPHRVLQPTICYGSMSNNWARNLAIKKEIKLLRNIISLCLNLINIFKSAKLKGKEEIDFIDEGDIRG